MELRNGRGTDEATHPPADVVYVCVDATRSNTLQTELEMAKRINARQALAMATVGHDLRQHLQTILLALDLVRPGVATSEHLQWLAIAREQAGLLAQGLEGLALAANMPAYAIQHERSSFLIATLLERIERKWSPVASAKKLQLRIDRTQESVRSNADLLFAVLDNLVGNAIKHTPRGSVGVYLGLEKSTLLVSIQDTGPGIDAEDLEAIFVPHWRGSADPSGMGLGLTIVQSSASLLDHPISVNSRLGRGTCFTVRVPLAMATLETAPRERRTDRRPIASARSRQLRADG